MNYYDKRITTRRDGIFEVLTPCGKHVICYPLMLDALASSVGVTISFVTHCECPNSDCIVTLKKRSVEFHIDHDLRRLEAAYESIPGLDQNYKEEFFYKIEIQS